MAFRKFLFFAALFTFCFGFTGYGQVASNYTASAAAYPGGAAMTLLNESTKTQLISGIWDNAVVATPIGFTFNFNGVNYTDVNVSANGFVTFGATLPSVGNSAPLSSTEAYAGAISAFGYNWAVYANAPGLPAPQANSVGKELSGAPGSRILKIEWRNVRRNDATNTTDYFDFQIWLYEGTNLIEVRFNTQANNVANNLNLAQLGLRGNTNADFNNYSHPSGLWTIPTLVNNGANTNVSAMIVRTGSIRIANTSPRIFTWTPAGCLTPSTLAVTPGSTTGNGAQITWTGTSPAPSNGYQYYYSTSAATPGSSATPTYAAATNGATITTMNGGTSYYVWVRSNCGGSFSPWVGPVNINTLCSPLNEEYFNYFDQGDPTYPYTAPAIQPCHSIQNVGAGSNWYTAAIGSPVDGFADEHLEYNANSQPANAWFYSQGVNLIAGKTYQLSYLYGGSTNFSFLTNRLEVKLGTAPYNTFMTQALDDHPNIKHGAIMNYVNFTVATTGTYYLGYHAYSIANQGKIFLDDIQLVPGLCIQPAAATVTALSATAASLTWSAPTPAPAGGYAYYVSTSPTTPTNNTTPTGYTSAGTTLVNLAGLTGGTAYYFWVRGNCTAGDFSMWSPVTNFNTPVLPPYCFPTTSQSPQAYISNVTITNAVQNINNSSAWTSPGHADYTAQTVIEAQGGNFNFSVGLDDGTAPAGVNLGVGVAIFVDWNNDGDFVDAGEKVFNTTGYTASNQGTVTGLITVPAGTTLGVKRMRVVIDYLNTNPNSCSFSGAGELEDYSLKVVTAPPTLALDITTSTQCAGALSPTVHITQGLGSYNTFTWTPAAGVSGSPAAGYTFNNGSTVTYTLTATQTSGDFSVNTAQYTYVANPLPTPITITPTPSTATLCQGGSAVQLTATGGVVSGLPILSENFNAGAPGWTTVNSASVGGNTAASAWMIRPDGYVPAGTWFGTTFHSNDASSFMLSDSDAQGIGSTTNVELISPVFSLGGYTAASLSFWHFYQQWTTSNARVEISTDGGTTYALLGGLTYNSNQGAASGFVQVQRDLAAYLGQTNLRIKFKYVAPWGWAWGIDNFLVSGNATSAITWSPVAGLYTDLAHTTPYVAGAGTTTVYAWPTATTTYTASASTPSPSICSTTTTQAITVTPIVAGTISADQTVCTGTITALTLTGQSGTVATWQSSADSAFTTPTNIAGSGGLNTLTSAVLGPVNTTTYIRAQITNGSCISYTNTVILSVTSTTWNGSTWSNGLPTATKRVIFAGNYTSSGNVSACSVAVTSGNVNIQPGHSMIVENAVNVTGGQLIFNNNSSLVQINNAAVNSGVITYIRTTTPMKKYDYTYWSSPLYNIPLSDICPDTRVDKYHEFNVSTGYFVTVPNTTIATPGRGYIMRAPDTYTSIATPYTSVMTMGYANNGIINYPVALSAPATNLNLLGNPYPSALDADLFLSNPTNAALLNGTIYFWTHNTPITAQVYNNNDYASYNLLGGTAAANSGDGNNNPPTKNIASANAFFATATANGNVVFNNSMRLAGSNDNFFRPAAERSSMDAAPVEKHRIWLNMVGGANAFKQALVGYVTNATTGIDRDFDGGVIESMNSISFYSLVEANKLTIQGRPLPFDSNDQVPMGYRANVAGTYTISIQTTDGIFADDSQNIYLEDLAQGTIHNLKTGSYSFATTAGTFDTRFVLRYTTQALQTPDHVFNENSVIVYKNSDVIYVNSGNATMDNVKIFDTRGRLVYEKKNVSDNQTQIAHLGAANQVLIVQVTSVDQKVVSKKIVF